MARSLSEAGWSVWIFHPRGTGLSERPADLKERDYGYQDYIVDGFAAIDFVKARADLPLMWVGHSLGGLIGLDIALRQPKTFDAIVTLGTPISLDQHTIGPIHYSVFKWFCKGLKTAYLGKVSTLVAPWSGWLPFLHPAPLYVNFDLIDKGDLRTALAQCFDDTPRRILDEFVDAIEHKDGPWDRMQTELSGLSIPLLAMMGGRDALAPLEVTQTISELGPQGLTECHQLEDYGHLELVLSSGIELEIVPKIRTWWSTIQEQEKSQEGAEEIIDLHSKEIDQLFGHSGSDEQRQIQSMRSPSAG
jgi:pimeloyl-ACP methyl ester carboxylesterase